MAEFHHQQNMQSGQPHQNYYMPSPLQHPQFGQQQRPQSQPMIQQQQQSPQQSTNNGMSPSMHNYLASQHHQQQMQNQIRSGTPPNQHTMIQQRQQGFTHPGMMQQMRQQQIQQQHGSPQQQQQMFQHQSVVQRQIVVRPVGIASPQQQQQNIGNAQPVQQSQQHFMQFVRQPGMQNAISSSSSMSTPVGQPQFVSPQHGQNHQLRQMLVPPGAIFRHQNVIIQREHKPTQIIRFPQQSSAMANADKLSPQQELHVLQQHFPTAQMHHQSPSPYQGQTSQPHRFIAHPQQQPSSHQHQIANGSPVAVFVTTSGQQYVPPSQQMLHHNFASPPHPSMIIASQQQTQNGTPTSRAESVEGHQMNEFGPTQLGSQESGRVSIKQEASPGEAVINTEVQNNQLQSPASADSQIAAAATTSTVRNAKKQIGKAPTKTANNISAATQKNIVNKAQSGIGNKPSPSESELIRASVPGQAAQKLLERDALDAFVKSVDPNEILEDEVAEALQLILDDFVEEIISNSSEVSKHRGSSRIEARDARFILANKMKMAIPSESLLGGTILNNNKLLGTGQPAAKRPALVAHQQRMALIDKTLKKL